VGSPPDPIASIRPSEADILELGMKTLLGHPAPADVASFERSAEMELDRKRSELKRVTAQVAELRPQVAWLLSSLGTCGRDAETVAPAFGQLKGAGLSGRFSRSRSAPSRLGRMVAVVPAPQSVHLARR